MNTLSDTIWLRKKIQLDAIRRKAGAGREEQKQSLGCLHVMRNTESFCARYKNEIYLFPHKPHFEADIYTTRSNFPVFTALVCELLCQSRCQKRKRKYSWLERKFTLPRLWCYFPIQLRSVNVSRYILNYKPYACRALQPYITNRVKN